jgi:16S rRNA (guanine1207-N2)-methyltransferase
MSARRDRRPEALPLDEGVLRDGPVCEFQASHAVEAKGGVIVQPWRDAYLAAQRIAEQSQAPVEFQVVAHAREIPDASYSQVVVHLQKSRAATFDDLRHAWRILSPGGQLLFTGTNTLGITSAVKRLAKQLDQTGIIVANRARARVVRFKKDEGKGPEVEATPGLVARVESIHGDTFEIEIETRPGVFSAKKLDAGSALLLEKLPKFVGHKPPKRVVDLGCGTGVLGLCAATLYPECEVLLVDADIRAVECAQANVDRLGLSDRVRVAWWDARETPLGDRFNLTLVNPPFHHRGPEVDLAPAFALFHSLSTWMSRSGQALIVANQTLPYEEALSRVGRLEQLNVTKGYKLLSLNKSARSSGSRGRNSPGESEFGIGRQPTRSR